MPTIKVGSSAATQLNAGAAILAAAATTDTRPIADRVTAFRGAQKEYADAHAKVQQAEGELDKAQLQFRTDHEAVVDALARALLADGQELRNPFAAFGGMTRGALLHMPAATAAKMLPQLVGSIRRSKNVGKLTLQVLPAAEKTMRGMEQAVAHIEALRAAVRDARATRAAVAKKWNADLNALKRGARAAADDGAPALYATLFDRPARSAGKSAKPERPAPQAPAASPAPQAEPAAS